MEKKEQKIKQDSDSNDEYDSDAMHEMRKSKDSKKEIPFWSENPNILLNTAYLTEFYPSSDMSYNQKLNAITRMLIVLTILVYVITGKVRSILFGILSLFLVYLVHYYSDSNKKKVDAFTGLNGQTKENSPALSALGNDADSMLVAPMEVFQQPNAANPFSNVLLTDINGNPSKKPAPPAYNDQTNKNVLLAAKEAVMNANPGQPDISDKLFKDLGEQLTFEQSMRQFYSTPSTTTPDDQKAFAEFCYGGMISCAEGNKFACARNAAAMRHTFV